MTSTNGALKASLGVVELYSDSFAFAWVATIYLFLSFLACPWLYALYSSKHQRAPTVNNPPFAVTRKYQPLGTEKIHLRLVAPLTLIGNVGEHPARGQNMETTTQGILIIMPSRMEEQRRIGNILFTESQ